jgi:hypothetical protein
MSALVFLAAAVVVSLIGSLIVLIRNRSPRSMDQGIDDFAERMRALEPDESGNERQR